MDLKQISQKLVGDDDERAVSPVIGVILMVAITVILAAVIAAFVLDMGDMGDTAPTVSFDWDQSDENGDDKPTVSITMASGESVAASEITVQDGDGNPQAGDTTDWNSDTDDLSSGQTHKIVDFSGDVVQIVWESDDGTSQVLDDYEVN